MSKERLPKAPRSELKKICTEKELTEAATIKDYLQVRREGTRQLEQFKSLTSKREKGGKP
jgi:hypothetical protein